MNEIAIRASDLSKRYSIGPRLRYRTLRDTITDAFTAPLRRKSSAGRNTIFALKNVSFEIKRGEVVGLVGRNGAGKSTLLKVLSRITEPTDGYADIRGRVGSLLEIGTGFHPELSGRENIYLNAAILGMKKVEVDLKFEEIVAFAEIEKFLDTPVKHYSSGMYVRLAFAVAAYLEPEVLLIDEVLAVGDIQFQKKCLGKMGDVAKGGRTIVFVSHNLGAVRGLCETALWLDHGEVVRSGLADDVVRAYENHSLRAFGQATHIAERDEEEARGIDFFVRRCELFNETRDPTNLFRYGEKFSLDVQVEGSPSERYSLEFYIYNEAGVLISVGASGPYHGQFFERTTRRVAVEVGPLTLTSGKYWITLSLMVGHQRADTWTNSLSFEVVECRPFNVSWEIPSYREGICVLQQSFRVSDERQ
jgi:lipopolysaccharide transport system ATP-binding protein